MVATASGLSGPSAVRLVGEVNGGAPVHARIHPRPPKEKIARCCRVDRARHNRATKMFVSDPCLSLSYVTLHCCIACHFVVLLLLLLLLLLLYICNRSSCWRSSSSSSSCSSSSSSLLLLLYFPPPCLIFLSALLILVSLTIPATTVLLQVPWNLFSVVPNI